MDPLVQIWKNQDKKRQNFSQWAMEFFLLEKCFLKSDRLLQRLLIDLISVRLLINQLLLFQKLLSSLQQVGESWPFKIKLFEGKPCSLMGSLGSFFVLFCFCPCDLSDWSCDLLGRSWPTDWETVMLCSQLFLSVSGGSWKWNERWLFTLIWSSFSLEASFLFTSQTTTTSLCCFPEYFQSHRSVWEQDWWGVSVLELMFASVAEFTLSSLINTETRRHWAAFISESCSLRIQR